MRIVLALAFLVLSLMPAAALEDRTGYPSLTPQQDDEIRAIVRRLLLNEPDLLERALENLRDTKDQDRLDRQREAIAQNRAAIFDDPRDIVLGDPSAPFPVVMWIDYNCTYCRAERPVIDRLLETNPRVKVIVKALPVLGAGSRDSAKIALAVRAAYPTLAPSFHRALLDLTQPANTDAAFDVATQMSLARPEISAIADSEAIETYLDRTLDLAEDLELTGTPTYLIGDTFYFGQMAADDLYATVNQAYCGTDACEN
ncbi:DsbA family protein [Amorphus sp. 3PC139-8]|uniref:DsbA family protein n=1 Tax=Amorphus sp. 3PC139-8 TaxID=2735676 RepID=UPI00345CFC03